MWFGSDLERLFLLAAGHFQPTPAEDRILRDVASVLGARGSLPSISRSANCVTVAAKHAEFFSCIEQVCRSSGLKYLRWEKELRIFIV